MSEPREHIGADERPLESRTAMGFGGAAPGEAR